MEDVSRQSKLGSKCCVYIVGIDYQFMHRLVL